MVYIENDGALFRGPARGVPQEVWSPSKGAFVPYRDAGKPKPIEWGHVISDAEAKELMSSGGEKGGRDPAAES